jgi:hypothetical protein
MSRKIWLPVVLAVVMAVVVAGGVFAQTATPPTQGQTPNSTAPNQQGKGFGIGPLGFFGGGRGQSNWTEFDAVAKALNLTPTQLFDQLHSGKSVTDIATAQKVDIATVQQAAQAAEQQAMKDSINQAVKDGRMTQAQADWLLQGIQNGYTRGFGGHGFEGRGGRGLRGNGLNGNGQQQAPSTQPSTQPSATPSM